MCSLDKFLHFILRFRNGFINLFHCCISNCITNPNTETIMQNPIIHKPLCMSKKLASSIRTNY
ncbi:unnamed protein product, partial [Vitis vinifera]|uniref:Uncharacterized protein n=1 Tax=Vitis vinifera TaxID=29760 RepID=D7SR53_VITVI